LANRAFGGAFEGMNRAFIVIVGTRIPHYKIRVSRAMPFDKMHNLRIRKSPRRPYQQMRMVGHDRVPENGKRFQFGTKEKLIDKKLSEYFLLKIRKPSVRHRGDEIRRARNVYSFLGIAVPAHIMNTIGPEGMLKIFHFGFPRKARIRPPEGAIRPPEGAIGQSRLRGRIIISTHNRAP